MTFLSSRMCLWLKARCEVTERETRNRNSTHPHTHTPNTHTSVALVPGHVNNGGQGYFKHLVVRRPPTVLMPIIGHPPTHTQPTTHRVTARQTSQNQGSDKKHLGPQFVGPETTTTEPGAKPGMSRSTSFSYVSPRPSQSKTQQSRDCCS